MWAQDPTSSLSPAHRDYLNIKQMHTVADLEYLTMKADSLHEDLRIMRLNLARCQPKSSTHIQTHTHTMSSMKSAQEQLSDMSQDPPLAANANVCANATSQSARIGLDITTHPPFIVLGVGELMDRNHILQGGQGYCNELVMPGDRLLQIDQHPISNKTTMQMMHDLLRGQLGSLVDLRFYRSEESRVFTVTVMRHVLHEEYEIPFVIYDNSTPVASSPAPLEMSASDKTTAVKQQLQHRPPPGLSRATPEHTKAPAPLALRPDCSDSSSSGTDKERQKMRDRAAVAAHRRMQDVSSPTMAASETRHGVTNPLLSFPPEDDALSFAENTMHAVGNGLDELPRPIPGDELPRPVPGISQEHSPQHRHTTSMQTINVTNVIVASEDRAMLQGPGRGAGAEMGFPSMWLDQGQEEDEQDQESSKGEEHDHDGISVEWESNSTYIVRDSNTGGLMKYSNFVAA